jgi:hypothetical protein
MGATWQDVVDVYGWHWLWLIAFAFFAPGSLGEFSGASFQPGC